MKGVVAMIFDMHCHSKEGSCDARVGIDETIEVLKEKGYDGMLVTDHNSYKGYYSITSIPENFVVLKGIEYDSIDSGHLLIILPSKSKSNIFEYRGLKGAEVLRVVHSLGGIVGPAHPFNYSKLGIGNTKFKTDLEYLNKFDFIETFNGSLNDKGHIKAMELAKELNKPCFSGSDSHIVSRVGFGKTEIFEDIKKEDDLIEVIKSSHFTEEQAKGSFVPRKIPSMHDFFVELGGFCYVAANECVSVMTKGKAKKLADCL